MQDSSLYFDQTLQRITELVAQWGLQVLGGLAVLVVGYLVAGWASRRVLKFKDRNKIDPTVIPIVAKIVRLAIVALTLVMVMNQFGIPVASLLAVLGAAGLAIGLGLQGTLSNVAAGIILLTMRPFESGDTIEIDGTLMVVDEIGLIMSKLHRLDNIFIAVPNSQLWGRPIANFSKNTTRRVDMVVGISYEDDIDKAIELIHEELKADARILPEPAPLVAVGELGDSSVNLLVRPWVNTPDFFPVKLDFTKRIKQRFDREGISIPFPQRDVHLFQASKSA